MTDFSHLDALETRLAHETVRLNQAKSVREKAMRQVWIDGIKREIESEKKFLGLDVIETLSDDELLAALQA